MWSKWNCGRVRARLIARLMKMRRTRWQQGVQNSLMMALGPGLRLERWPRSAAMLGATDGILVGKKSKSGGGGVGAEQIEDDNQQPAAYFLWRYGDRVGCQGTKESTRSNPREKGNYSARTGLSISWQGS